MRVRAYLVFGGLFLFCLIIDVACFGALVNEPGVGPAVAASARAQSPLAHTYIVIGRPLARALPPLQACGQALADTAWGDAYPAIMATPEAASDLVFSESRGPVRALCMLFYWLAPALLVLTIAAWLLRTRHTHLIKTGR